MLIPIFEDSWDKKKIIEKVDITLKNYKINLSKKKLLILISGGPDSVALLSIIHKLYPLAKLYLLNVNYGLRKNDSDKESLLIESLALSYNASLYAHYVNQNDLEGSSLQLKARTIRYNLARAIEKSHQIEYILVGHHLNDYTETLLLKILHGDGIFSLNNFDVLKDGILRPLLFVNKSEILDYLKEGNHPYYNDQSNQNNKYKRNFLRNVFLKELNEEFNQSNDHLNSFFFNIKSLTQFFLRQTTRFYTIESNIIILKPPFFKENTIIQLLLLKSFFLQYNTNIQLSKTLLNNILLSIKNEKLDHSIKKKNTFSKTYSINSGFINIQDNLIWCEKKIDQKLNDSKTDFFQKHPQSYFSLKTHYCLFEIKYLSLSQVIKLMSNSTKPSQKINYFEISESLKNLIQTNTVYFKKRQKGDRLVRYLNTSKENEIKIKNIYSKKQIPKLLNESGLLIAIEKKIYGILWDRLDILDIFLKKTKKKINSIISTEIKLIDLPSIDIMYSKTNSNQNELKKTILIQTSLI